MSMYMEEQFFACQHFTFRALRGMEPDTVPAMETRSVDRLRRLREWARSLDFTLARRFGLANREDRLFFLLIGGVGVVGGLLGAATDLLIGLVQTLLWGSRGDLLTIVPKVHRWVVVAAPAIGGALLGIILWLSRRRATGQAAGRRAARGWRC